MPMTVSLLVPVTWEVNISVKIELLMMMMMMVRRKVNVL